MSGDDIGWKRWGGIGIVVVAMASLVLLSAYDSNRFAPGLTLPLVVALLGLLGLLVQMDANFRADARRREHERILAHTQAMNEAKMQTFLDRKNVYEALIEPFKNLLIGKFIKNQRDAQILNPEGMAKAKFDLLTYGSDTTIRALTDFFAMGAKANSMTDENKSVREAANLVFFARLIKSIRNDLGLADGDLDEILLLRLVLTDLDQNEARIRSAMGYNSAAEVP